VMRGLNVKGSKTLLISQLGGAVLVLGALAVIASVVSRLRSAGAASTAADRDGLTLEWGAASPPPAHNFDTLPPIRSERPVFDAHHPEVAARTPR